MCRLHKCCMLSARHRQYTDVLISMSNPTCPISPLHSRETRDQFVIALEEFQLLGMGDLWPFLSMQDVCIQRTPRNLPFSLRVVSCLPLKRGRLNRDAANLSHSMMETIQVLTLAARVIRAWDCCNNWQIISYQYCCLDVLLYLQDYQR